MNELNSRITSCAQKFFESGQFADCIIKSQQGSEFRCHRIILSKQSRFFYNYFNQNIQNENELTQEIVLPFSDEATLNNFISFLYSGHIHLTSSSAPIYLKYATVYEVSTLKMVTNLFIKKVINSNNILQYIKIFLQYDLIDEVCSYSKMLADKLILNNDKIREQLFNSICPKVLFSILKEEKVRQFYSQDKIIEFIDEFNDINPITNIDDKKDLESLINWGDPFAYFYFTKNRCDWTTPKTSRRFLNKVLEIRRRDLMTFSKEANGASDKVSRWYPYVWLHNIAYAQPIGQTPEVKLVEFMSTLGIAKVPINPEAFGFLQIDATEPIHEIFAPRNAVSQDDTYYLSKDMSKEENGPYYSIYISEDAKFLPSQFILDSNIPKLFKGERYRDQPYPKSVMLSGGSKGDDNPLFSSVLLEDGKASVKLITKDSLSFLKVTMNGEENGGGRVFRIKQIDFIGRFLPK